MSVEDEGGSLKKKVVAGVAIGVATTAAAGAAKKLMGNGSHNGLDDVVEDAKDKTTAGAKRVARATKSRAKSTARSGAKRGQAARSSTKRASSRTGKRASATKRATTARARTKSSTGSSARQRTKEQLLNQARRLKIEGRSSMTKAQLERAVARAKR
jgi:hypothetical protein